MTRRNRTVANLERTARQLVADNTPAEEARAQVLLVSSDPIALGIAAGRALGRWETLPLFNPADQEVAALLGNAGADNDTLHATADDTARRLRRYMKLG